MRTKVGRERNHTFAFSVDRRNSAGLAVNKDCVRSVLDVTWPVNFVRFDNKTKKITFFRGTRLNRTSTIHILLHLYDIHLFRIE